jgi:hypothetical protein
MSVDLLRDEVSPTMGSGVTSATISKRRRWFLLFLFSVSQVSHVAHTLDAVFRAHSQYLDIASRASALVFIDDISKDLGITYETSTWILVSALFVGNTGTELGLTGKNSYGVTFGSFLLLWGRVSDLYDSKKAGLSVRPTSQLTARCFPLLFSGVAFGASSSLS